MYTEINLIFSYFCGKAEAHKHTECCFHEDLQGFQLSEEVREKYHGKQS